MMLDVERDKAPFTCIVIMRRVRPREDRRGKVEVNFALFINLAFSFCFANEFNIILPLSSARSVLRAQITGCTLCEYMLEASRLSRERLMRFISRSYIRGILGSYIYIYDSHNSNFR